MNLYISSWGRVVIQRWVVFFLQFISCCFVELHANLGRWIAAHIIHFHHPCPSYLPHYVLSEQNWNKRYWGGRLKADLCPFLESLKFSSKDKTCLFHSYRRAAAISFTENRLLGEKKSETSSSAGPSYREVIRM